MGKVVHREAERDGLRREREAAKERARHCDCETAKRVCVKGRVRAAWAGERKRKKEKKKKKKEKKIIEDIERKIGKEKKEKEKRKRKREIGRKEKEKRTI